MTSAQMTAIDTLDAKLERRDQRNRLLDVIKTAIATAAFLTCGWARAADSAPSATCKVTIRADGAIVTHCVVTVVQGAR